MKRLKPVVPVSVMCKMMRHTVVVALLTGMVLIQFLGVEGGQHHNIDQDMKQRLTFLQKNAERSILVHVHIPKSGGTALSSALSSNCKCLAERPVSHHVSQPNCKKCTTIRGSNGIRTEYTVSRSTGWKFGVHAPYAVLEWGMTASRYSVTPYNIVGAYIIMLRSPFERFLSEATNWTGKKGQAVDWSIRLKKDNSIVYYKGVNADCLDCGFSALHCQKYNLKNSTTKNKAEKQLKPYVKLYASLPQHFIIQNRQSKMVGGTVHNFDMRFDADKQVGTRWRTHTQGATERIYEAAYTRLSSQQNVILTLQERFAESICILEIVYGHLYKFNWTEDVHSHNKNKAFDLEEVSAKKKSDQHNDVYQLWAKSNHADLKLYAAAQEIFDVQFKLALDMLWMRKETSKDLNKKTPHCVQFL